MSTPFFYGLIEGFYGRAWPWDVRLAYADFLRHFGYDCYIFAPKSERALRAGWRESLPAALGTQLELLGRHYRERGLRWGLALSPLGLEREYREEDRRALQAKLRQLRQLEPDILCLLFDDMPGGIDELAARQSAIVADVAAAEVAPALWVCPTYYSFDPVLETLFGDMPERYLETLGERLPPAAQLFWTGNGVLNARIAAADIDAVSRRLGRAPLLWDNYPVNDGRKTSNFLHLRAFDGRDSALRERLAGHLVNPMNQPLLSQLPLATLQRWFRDGDRYDPGRAWEDCAVALFPAALIDLLRRDLQHFQDDGLSALTTDEVDTLAAEYSAVAHPAAAEVVSWLRGEYRFDPECLND